MPTRRVAEAADTDSPFSNGPSDYFRCVMQRCARAMDACGSTEYTVRIGRSCIRLVFAGDALVSVMLPALRHLLEVPVLEPDFTIYLVDSHSTDFVLPDSPWDSDGIPPEKLGEDGEGRVLYHDDRFRMYFYLGQTVYLADFESRRAVFWTPDAQALPYYESGAPLRMLFHWLFSSQGWHLVHAACVGTNRGGVLLAGKGGSGKSTTALTCLADGLSYVGDDYCLVCMGDSPVAHSIFSSAKVNADNLVRVPHLGSAMVNGSKLETEKALFFVADTFPDRVARELPIRAILLPTVTNLPDTEVRRTSAARALHALAPSTLFQLADMRTSGFQLMGQLARAVPAYDLLLGTRLEQIPPLVRSVCDAEARET